MKKATVGFAMCGSFCTFSNAIEQMRRLKETCDILPIMSANAYGTDTRFGKAEDIRKKVESICGKEIIHTIAGAEPLGPQKMCNLLIVAPATGNTLSKLANGITDTSVTMAVKSVLRILRPVLICAATNDALGASAKNIGLLLNTKNIYFVPLRQDNPDLKPTSLVADFQMIPQAAEAALECRQLQPVLF